MLVVIPCGGKKAETPCPAGEMYTGPYHRACQLYARSLVPPDRVFVLSAKYGLLGLDETVEPYDLRMGDPGCVSVRTVLDQAEALEILTEEDVTALGGVEYVRVVLKVWPSAKLPLKGVGGIGKQLAWLKEHS